MAEVYLPVDGVSVCSELTRKGKPCGAPPVRGEGKCAGHLGLGGLDAKKGAQASAHARTAKAELRKRSALDWAAVKLEEHAEELVGTFLVAARDGDWRAAAALIERVHGKPVERVETLDLSDDPQTWTREQRAELRRRLVTEHPELLELDPDRKATGAG